MEHLISRLSVAAVVVALGAGMSSGIEALAHTGHDHGKEALAELSAPPVSSALNPGGLRMSASRQPDGSVFLPKPAQRVLGVTTVVAQLTRLPRTVELAGQVIADPRHAGRIDAVQAGVIAAPGAHGLPNLGQRVRKGELLALLQPSLSTVERARQQSELAEINRDLAIADQQYSRVRGQISPEAGAAPRNDAPTAGLPQSSFSVIQSQLQALRARKQYLEESLKSSLPLTAPVAGIVSTSRAFVGKVVQPGETLFEIVDPLRLWVEALSYETGIGRQVASARALGRDGAVYTLTFRGQGFQLREQAVPLQFALTLEEPLLAVGQPLRVIVELNEMLDGALLPRAAVTRRSGNDAVVWVQTGAERFRPQPVTATEYDATRVIVSGALRAGERIVVAGSQALEQTR